MKIKNKLLQHLAISLEFARIRAIWIAQTMLLALGVIEVTEPDITGEPYGFVTGSLVWLIWVKRRERLQMSQ